MEVRTYYIPCNQIGRHLLNYLMTHINWSFGSTCKVGNKIALTVSAQKRDISKIEYILKMYKFL
jgi:hypothetical protein